MATGQANRARGAFGERLVALWYERRGYRVLDRNWRDGRRGELDLVLERADGLVVVCEVKARASVAFGDPFEAVHPAKVTRLYRLAAAWTAAHGRRDAPTRVDVASVLGADVTVRQDIGPAG